ncbi:MAG: hypothetical protein JSV36_21675 [Anaerolineae bacterium]|nr:MAG: hypothetical protein JSV36_21675 [Anaerolineae bacterium]
MNRTRISLLLAIVALAALLLAAAPKARISAAADSASCRISGSWIGYLKEPPGVPTLMMQETLTPLDPAAKRLAYVLRLVNPDATFFGLDPGADYMTELVGEVVKTGEDTYDFSAIGYATRTVPGRNEIRYIWVLSGSMECEGNTKIDTASISVFMAGQDSDEDGFPDEGEVPVLYIPPSTFSTAKRVP